MEKDHCTARQTPHAPRSKYLFRLQAVEGAVSSLKAGQEPEAMFWITQSIIQNACDAMVLHRAFVENWNPPLLH
jgi:hypothetical protein